MQGCNRTKDVCSWSGVLESYCGGLDRHMLNLSCKLIHCLNGRLGFFALSTLTCTELTFCDGQLEPFSN